MSERHFTTSDGIRLHYSVHGTGPETVLLVHGLAAGGRQFEADASYFAEQGFRVLVPDLRGHGRSGAPSPHEHEGFSIARFGSDMVELLAHADADTVHWVGNSLGGIIALPLLRSRPEIFRSFAIFGTAFRLGLPALTPHLVPLPHRLAGKRLTAWSTARMTTRERSAWPLVASLIAEFDPRVGRAIARHVHRYDLREEARNFAGPMLMLRGGRDRAVNLALPMSLAAMEGKPNFTLVELREGGHCANLDASEAWRAALLRFWEKASLTPHDGRGSASA